MLLELGVQLHPALAPGRAHLVFVVEVPVARRDERRGVLDRHQDDGLDRVLHPFLPEDADGGLAVDLVAGVEGRRAEEAVATVGKGTDDVELDPGVPLQASYGLW